MSNPARLVFVFPGQGSQRVGMFGEGALPQVAAAARELSEALGENLIALSEDEGKLNATVNAQPALLAAGVGTYRAWRESGGKEPVAFAGHSLGEYAALVCAGALELSRAGALVRARAEAMQAAVPAGAGAMVAILGLEAGKVKEICAKQASCWVANVNSPQQIVIAGRTAGVEAAANACKQAGARRVVALPVSVPSHCPLMEAAQAKLGDALSDARIKPASAPVLHNATNEQADSAEGIREALVAQLVAPVNWVKIVTRLAQLGGGDSLIVECAAGRVLHGLNRRIVDASLCASLDSDAALQELLARS